MGFIDASIETCHKLQIYKRSLLLVHGQPLKYYFRVFFFLNEQQEEGRMNVRNEGEFYGT